MTGIKVPYVDLQAQHTPIKQKLMDAVERVIDHGQFILGEEVAEFESRFAELCNVRYAVGVNSGTDALTLALRALGVGPGDEVITPPNSFVSSAGCIVAVGATPVFVDVREDYNLDPGLIENTITRRTKAILPVHLTGRPAEMELISEIAKKHNLRVVEDAAQAVAAEYYGKRVGSLGDVGCFSLHPLKNLNACGDGGVVTTNDINVYQDIKTLRNIGLRTRDNCVAWAPNSRLDTMQAAILMVKLDYLEEWTEQRRSNASVYQKSLAGIEEIRLPEDLPHQRAVYHTFVIQAERRAELVTYLTEQGIGTAVHYPIPIHLQQAAEHMGHGRQSFPVTEKQANQILSLPVHPNLDSRQMEHVANSIRRFYEVS
jgi:dTDP-4-amino-4,6-dideoxygalactose transaminase